MELQQNRTNRREKEVRLFENDQCIYCWDSKQFEWMDIYGKVDVKRDNLEFDIVETVR